MTVPFDLESLNPEQREAVEWPGGPMLVFAGAGSGKTRVLTCRISRIVSEGTWGSRIMAVTFTNKAANEMRERIERMVGAEARAMWLGTFHSLCARMLRIDGAAIGLDPDFVIYDDADQMALMKDLLKATNLDEKAIQPRAVLHAISSAKERLVGPQDFGDDAYDFFTRIVADLYAKYEKRLRDASAMDFDDLLLFAVRLLEQSPEVLTKYQDRFLHVLVDEYQDVNLAQYRFADLVSGKHRNIVVVGDDDQSIYAWRGADVSLMLRFASDHPDAKVITLSQNYRSTKRILEAANAVIRHNRSRAEKTLWTDNEAGVGVTVSEAGTESEEAMIVADRIVSDVRSGRRKLADFAILYRTHAQSRVIEDAFVTMRIPYILIGGTRFYERKEIKDMIAYLRVVQNPRDDVSFRRAIKVPTRGIGDVTMKALEALAQRLGTGLWEAAHDPEFQNAISKKALFGFKHFFGVIDEGRRIAADGPVTPVLKHLMNRSGYMEELKAEHTEESQARLEVLQEFVNAAVDFDRSIEDDRAVLGSEGVQVFQPEDLEPVRPVRPVFGLFDEPIAADTVGMGLATFLANIALLSDYDAAKRTGDVVTLMTLHSAKGLEFPVVFLLGLEEGIFPHSRSAGNEAELEEERRLCYVGMTRAREELHLTYAVRRTVYGQPSFNIPSRFVQDIAHLVEDSLSPRFRPTKADIDRTVRRERTGGYVVVEPRSEESLLGPSWEPPFKVGKQVRHAKFGIGVVVACNPLKNDAEITVAFPGMIGIKKLLHSLAKLESV